MKRRVFNFAAGVSLVLCVATLVLWVRSHWRVDTITLYPNGTLILLQSRQGLILAQVAHPFASAIQARPFASRRADATWADYGVRWGTGGMRVHSFDVKETRFWNVAVLHGIVMFALAMLPVIWLRRPLARRESTLCANCGYDLRATPDRCPECGAVPAAVEEAAVQSLAEPQ